MTTLDTITCPRCCTAIPDRPGLRFCPRCGLPAVHAAAADASPADVTVGRRTYRVLERIAVCISRSRELQNGG